MYGYSSPGLAFGKVGVFAQGLAHLDYLSSLPEDVQEEVNFHEDEFHNEAELHDFVENLMRRA